MTKVLLPFFMMFFSLNTVSKTINLFAEEAGNPSKVMTIKSPNYSIEREFIVHTPAGYEQNQNIRYPVIYLLGGTKRLKSLINASSYLALKHKMPPVIIVALSTQELRKADYTPSDIHMRKVDKYGQADRYLRFLKNTLIPHIDNQFRSEPFRIISGSSLGGLFVTNDFISKKPLFNAHFAFSPSLFYDDYFIFKKLDKALQSGNLKKGFLYAQSGGDENENILSALARLRASLTNYANPQITWHAEIAEHESHGTTAFAGHYLALRKLFRNWDKPAKKYQKLSLSELLQMYESLSQEYGYSVTPGTWQLLGVGYGHLKKKEFDRAVEAFKLNIRYYPNANAYDSLADAFEAQGLIKQAKDSVDKAVGLVELGGAYYKGVMEHRERLYEVLNVRR